MASNQEIFREKKVKKIHLSLIFLFFIITISIWSYYYDWVLAKTNAGIQKIIDIKNWEIKKLKEDKNLQILDLLDNNRDVINKLRAYSEITSFINHLEDLWAIYAIKFSWFNFNAWILTTSIISETDEASDNREALYDYQKVASFIKDYRNDTESMFDLGFIKSINSKTSNIESLDITLSLKDDYIQKVTSKNNKKIIKKSETTILKEDKQKEENTSTWSSNVNEKEINNSLENKVSSSGSIIE